MYFLKKKSISNFVILIASFNTLALKHFFLFSIWGVINTFALCVCCFFEMQIRIGKNVPNCLYCVFLRFITFQHDFRRLFRTQQIYLRKVNLVVKCKTIERNLLSRQLHVYRDRYCIFSVSSLNCVLG